ncbi:MAG: flagellar biosynthesis anti-sigma factor FlgM [Polyangiales bacterium]
MRIPDSYSRLGINAAQATQKVSQVKGSPVDDAHPTSAEDVHVRLSAKGRELSMQADGEVDGARVARLKASIESGEFKVDARRIADRMLQGG